MHDLRSVKFLLHLILLGALSALTGAAWVAHRPVELPSPAQTKEGARTPDLADELKQAVIKGNGVVEITEDELNRHLKKVLMGRIAAPLTDWVQWDSLTFRLKPEVAQMRLGWLIGSHRSTVTLNLRVVRLDKVFRIEVLGGSYGHLEVPRGFLRPVLPVLKSLATVLEEEIQALFQMNQVRVADGKLVLDPRFQ